MPFVILGQNSHFTWAFNTREDLHHTDHLYLQRADESIDHQRLHLTTREEVILTRDEVRQPSRRETISKQKVKTTTVKFMTLFTYDFWKDVYQVSIDSGYDLLCDLYDFTLYLIHLVGSYFEVNPKQDFQFTSVPFTIEETHLGPNIQPLLLNISRPLQGSIYRARLQRIVLASQALNGRMNLDFFRLLNTIESKRELRQFERTASTLMEGMNWEMIYALRGSQSLQSEIGAFYIGK